MKKVVLVLVLLFVVSSCTTGNVVNAFDRCTDTDGFDIASYGKVRFFEGGHEYEYKDTCASTKRVREGVCVDGQLQIETVPCEGSRCKYGRCKVARYQ